MPPPPETTTPNAERLLKLRKAVVNAPVENFDMSAWQCGTRSCAAGWYVRSNPNCGLVLVAIWPIGHIRRAGNLGIVPVAERTVLAEHFGLSDEQAFYLFLTFDSDGGTGETDKTAFLAKLDALLAARGIAAGATEGAGT